jgi:hypothetical protein
MFPDIVYMYVQYTVTRPWDYTTLTGWRLTPMLVFYIPPSQKTFRNYLKLDMRLGMCLAAAKSTCRIFPGLKHIPPTPRFVHRVVDKPPIFIFIFGGIFSFFSYCIQHCFICRPSDSTVPTNAGIEPRTVATGTLTVRRSNH